MAKLLEQKPELRDRVCIRFVGAHPDWLYTQVRQFGLVDTVEFQGYLNHKECLEFQSSCDCLLITSAKVVDGEDYCISSKTFEYVATGKPILAVVAPGAQRDFLQNCGMAQICDPDNPVETAARIEQLIAGNVQMQPNQEFLAGFHGRAVSRSVAGTLHQIITDGHFGNR